MRVSVLPHPCLYLFGDANAWDFGCSNRCTVISCFILQFPNDIWCRTFFHILFTINVSSFKVSAYIFFAHFLIEFLIFLPSFKITLYTWDNSLFSDNAFCKCVFPVVTCLLILLTVTLTKIYFFLILIKSNILIFSFLNNFLEVV